MTRRTTVCAARQSFRIDKQQAPLQGKKMASHNSKADTQVKIAASRIEADLEEVRVVRLNLQEAEELSISNDLDSGSDPYNSTGQHVILKVNRDLSD